MTKLKNFLPIILALTAMFTRTEVGAQDSLPRPVTSVYRLEAGAANARSTYLSPLRYSGSIWSVSGDWSKAFQKNPEHLVMSFSAALNYRSMLNPPGSARMLGIDARFDWGMAYRWHLPENLQLTAGALFDLTGGALYLPRNGNNPVTIPVRVGFDIDASLSWRFKIGKLPMLLTDRVSIPFIGAFFSPQYGETFYEIYLGNHSGLAHCGWWGNNFGINNLLSVKMDFGRTALEIGYRYDYKSYYANHLFTATAANSFVIGVIPQGLGMKNRKKAIYAGY